MKEGNKKSAVITLRCTPDMEKRIKNKAGQLGKPVSEIVMGYINEGLKKNTKYDKQRARVLVEYTVDSAYLDYGGKMCDNRLYFYHGY